MTFQSQMTLLLPGEYTLKQFRNKLKLLCTFTVMINGTKCKKILNKLLI